MSGGCSIVASALASVLPINIQDWSPLGLTGLISSQPRDSQESSPIPQFESINRTADVEAETPILWPPDVKSWLIWKKPWCWERLGAGGEGDDRGWDGWMASPTRWTWVWVNSRSWWWTGRPGVLRFMGSQRVGHDWATELNWTAFFMVQLSHPYMTTGKTIALTRWTFIDKLMSLLFNTLSRFVIVSSSPPRSKHLLISWLQPPSAVLLCPPKIKPVTVSVVSPPICHEVMWSDPGIFTFWMLSFKPLSHCPLSL